MARRIKKIPRRYIIVALAIVVLAIGIGSFAFSSSNKSSPTIPSTNPIAEDNSTKIASDNPQSEPSQASNGAKPSEQQNGPAPAAPFGSFVSNHHPGGDTPTSEASTCNTTPGATCYIQFSSGSQTKKLDPHIADAHGSAIWYWDIKSAGLTSGSWSVTAIASLNNQTKTSSDPMALVVQ
jgi:cytoskeletal protein RodZ